MTHRRTIYCLSALPLLLVAGMLVAGPLDPPAGPVAPTAKPMAEVEPRTAVNAANTPGDSDSLFRITQPGSYYLAGNIAGVTGKAGIEIAATGVTLDLNGMDLAGAPGSLSGVILSVSSPVNISVFNGSVRNWGGSGIDLQFAGAINSRIARINATGNGANGIAVAAGNTICDCTCGANTLAGIATQNACTVTGCTSRGNLGAGISIGSGCTISGCAATANSLDGISAAAGCVITDCSSTSNGNFGITGTDGCTVSGCAARANAVGIRVAQGGAVSRCSSDSNLGDGIQAGAGGTVSDCTANANTGDGIQGDSRCSIRYNICGGNGAGAGDGANIVVNGGDNRIEGNNCSVADRGVQAPQTGNIIIRNTCSGNTTDWVIAANNVVGPVLDRRAPASAAINGFSAPDSTGTTHPDANFSY